MTTPLMTHGDAVRHLTGMLQRTFDRSSPVEIFRGFIQACHLALDDLPAHLHYALTSSSIAAPDSRERWEQAMKHFRPKTLEAFAEGFAVLLMACRGLGDGWVTDSVVGPDVIGSVYMDLLSGRSNKYNYRGQFFTPWNVCLMMSKMLAETNLEGKFHREVKALIAEDPVLQVLTLTAGLAGEDNMAHEDMFLWWLKRAWPFIRPKLTPIRVNEPCVGSGRMLLAFAACHPLWLSQIGYIEYTGCALDQLCVDMARLNMRLYGLTPMRLEAVTLDALESRLSTIAGPWAPAYQAVLEAPPAQRPVLQAEVVKQINRTRIEQLSLFEE